MFTIAQVVFKWKLHISPTLTGTYYFNVSMTLNCDIDLLQFNCSGNKKPDAWRYWTQIFRLLRDFAINWGLSYLLLIIFVNLSNYIVGKLLLSWTLSFQYWYNVDITSNIYIIIFKLYIFSILKLCWSHKVYLSIPINVWT